QYGVNNTLHHSPFVHRFHTYLSSEYLDKVCGLIAAGDQPADLIQIKHAAGVRNNMRTASANAR
ncbi:MAG TPA: hypothetical protein VH593_31105, partial [Ktedonobacteraceae bacterium]